MYASFGGREAGDISAWLDAIAGRLAGLDPTAECQAAIWGRSMGAAIAMRAAAVDRRIAALVLESPMVDLDASVATLLRKRGLRFTRILARMITRRAGRIAGVPLHRPTPVDVAPRVACRTLIVHGSDDWIVPQADVRRLAGAFPTLPRRIEVPGAGHSNVVGTGGEVLVGRIAEFLDEDFGGGRVTLMQEPYFPEKAVAILRAARYDSAARPSLELISGSFIWWDEDYLEFAGTCRGLGCRAYQEPIRFRTSIIMGSPDESCRRGWEELQRACPEWPGFRPERRSESLRAELERQLSEEY
jgi:dienelactone hydrolase